MHIDQLESRQLLTATLVNGTLSILGTTANDQINISLSKTGKVTVTEKTILVSGNVTVITNLGTHTFAASAIGQVIIRTTLGNDTVTCTGGATNPYRFPTTIDCGPGDDSLAGGAGADRLIGGDGNDRLTGNAGNDTLLGDAGNDRLYGNDGNDQLFGAAGQDSLTGGNGADLLDGGLNNDYLYADDGIAGNDTIQGGGADIPTIPTRTSGDYAVIDAGDLITKVRRVVTINPI
jgi:Ca2+-binding RTX toxin-like protein